MRCARSRHDTRLPLGSLVPTLELHISSKMHRHTFLLLSMSLAFAFSKAAAEPAKDTRCFEMRVYFSPAGKLDDLHARFRNHTVKLFEKHGMTNIGYWVPIENTDNKLIYVLAYPSREAREASWKAFEADPDWQAAKADSEKNGKLVEKVESTFLSATDFSPEIKPSSAAPRVFELRTYTTTPNNLDRLLKRFREHTVELFKKHGMTNFAYWTLMKDQPGAENTLTYILAHKSKEAAAASFKAFRADPDWIAAKEASEKEGGGSLTVTPDGVKSVFMQATDYSPTK
jgi:NIPSNAP